MSKFDEIVKKHKEGITVNLFITASSKRNIFPSGLNKWRKSIEMKVCSPAQDNKANMEVLKTIAKFFKKPYSNIILISGGKKREKTILVKNLNVKDAEKKLEESLDGL